MYNKVMEYEEEQFVRQIYAFPCLFDSKDKYYKDISMRENAWKKIGARFCISDTDLLRKRWDYSIKEKYIRMRKKYQYQCALLPSGCSIKNNHPANDWPLFTVVDNLFGPFIKLRNRQRKVKKKSGIFSNTCMTIKSESGTSPCTAGDATDGICYLEVCPDLPQATTDKSSDMDYVDINCLRSNTEHPCGSTSSGYLTSGGPPSEDLEMKQGCVADTNEAVFALAKSLHTVAAGLQSVSRLNERWHVPQDEIEMYCLSYAARLKTLPTELADDIRCEMERLIKDAHKKVVQMK